MAASPDWRNVTTAGVVTKQNIQMAPWEISRSNWSYGRGGLSFHVTFG